MASAASSVDFAIIGHQDNWEHIERFVNWLRAPVQEKLSPEKVKQIFSFFPPRAIFRIKVRSLTGAEVNGVYIETFIDPDKLGPQYIKTNILKVMDAAICAEKEQAGITTLGGFTSIVLEGNLDPFSNNTAKFTTGNTLTAAFIVKGVEQAAIHNKINLAHAQLLIVGATGDIGMACASYFKNKVKKLLLCARNLHRLGKYAQTLFNEKIEAAHSISVDALVPDADVVICVTSSTGLNFTGCKKNVLICDAGYPKNLDKEISNIPGVKLFHGGMGQVNKGFQFQPDYSESIYNYPAPNIAHGCILEAIVLAFEKRLENYSSGRGNITVEKMEIIYALAQKHGITIAPFYNSDGLW